MNKIIVFEPNDFHGVVVAGVVGYFKDLGYYCDVYIKDNTYKELSEIDFGENILLHRYKDEVDEILFSEKTREYDFVFFTSMEYSTDGEMYRYLDLIGENIKTKYGYMGIYHTAYFIRIFNEEKAASEGRIFCISDFQKQVPGVRTLFPGYYYFSKGRDYTYDNNSIKIVTLGSMLDEGMIVDGKSGLSSADRDRITFYHVGGEIVPIKRQIYLKMKKAAYRLASVCIKKCRKKALRYEVIELGRVSLKRLLEIVNDSSFIHFGIDNHSYRGMHYLSSSTSGSRLIVLGTGVLPICHSWVNKLYFSDENAGISYNRELASGLTEALNMSDADYKKRTEELISLQQRVYEESLGNLKDAIHDITMGTP